MQEGDDLRQIEVEEFYAYQFREGLKKGMQNHY